MHEMALCRNVVDIVIEEAQHANASEVKAVHLTIGYSRDIVEDLFEGMFQWMCRDTIAANAELSISRIPLTVKCEDCGLIYHIDAHDSHTWSCPRCSARHYKLNSGMEFYVSNIEVA